MSLKTRNHQAVLTAVSADADRRCAELRSLCVGSVVRYTGRVPDQGTVRFVVRAIECTDRGTQMRLYDRAYPWFELSGVTLGDVYPDPSHPGRLELCRCAHEYANHHHHDATIGGRQRSDDPSRCLDCGCVNHAAPVS